jgi:hypothetical protein
MAHRFSYEAYVGPIGAGLHIDHLCRVRSCVNPKHLEPVTQRVNTLRGEGRAALQLRVTHCPRGHEYTPDNIYLWRGHRACRTCVLARGRRRYAASRQAG